MYSKFSPISNFLGHDAIVELLLRSGASSDINLQVTDPVSDGDTALHAAVLSGMYLLID